MNDASDSREIDAAVLLCRIKESGNLGSICRAMKTMGITRLVLADCPDYDQELVRTMAVHAAEVYENAQRYSTLEDALSGFSLSAGFTRRTGARRKGASLSARDFARTAAGLPLRGASFTERRQSLALVFGNERDGLSDKELALCSMAVYIPSSDKFPSLNVAQAVQIACYELFMSSQEAEAPAASGEGAMPDSGEGRILPRRNIEQGIDGIIRAFAARGAFKQRDDTYLRCFLRDLCERAGVRRSDLEYLQKSFFKAFALGSKSDIAKRPRGK
ncbi:MAG: RNA methyltransferase [Spirochaetia bacterium]|nr:RNA methyltransferase [Spirochaetia bacterium]